MRRGFTLVELLIAISIMILLAAVAVPIYGNLQNLSQKEQASYKLLQDLRAARQDALSRINNNSQGIKISVHSYVVFQGSSYATRTASFDRNIDLGNNLSLTSNLSNNEIVFTRGSGMPSGLGSITVTESLGASKQITINKFGIAKIE